MSGFTSRYNSSGVVIELPNVGINLLPELRSNGGDPKRSFEQSG